MDRRNSVWEGETENNNKETEHNIFWSWCIGNNKFFKYLERNSMTLKKFDFNKN